MLSAQSWGKLSANIVRRCTHNHIPLCAQECVHDLNRINKQLRQWSFMQKQKRDLAKLKREKRIASKKVPQVNRLPKYTHSSDESDDHRRTPHKSVKETAKDLEIGPDGVPYDYRHRLKWLDTNEFKRISPEMFKMMEKYQHETKDEATLHPQSQHVKFKTGVQFNPVGLDKVNPGFAAYLRQVMQNDIQLNALYDISFYPKPGEPIYLADESEENQQAQFYNQMNLGDVAGILEILKNGNLLSAEQLERLFRFMSIVCQFNPENMMEYFRLLQSHGVLTPEILKYLRELLLNTGINIPPDMLNRLFETLLLIDNEVKLGDTRYEEFNERNQNEGLKRSTDTLSIQSNMNIHHSDYKFKKDLDYPLGFDITGPLSMDRLKYNTQSTHSIYPDLVSLHKVSLDPSQASNRHARFKSTPAKGKKRGKAVGYYEPWSYTGPLRGVRQAYRMGVARRLSTVKNSARSSFDMSREITKMREMDAIRKVFPANFFNQDDSDFGLLPVPEIQRPSQTERRSNAPYIRKQSQQLPQFLLK